MQPSKIVSQDEWLAARRPSRPGSSCGRRPMAKLCSQLPWVRAGRVYLAIVALTMFVLPVASVLIEHSLRPDAPVVFLLGRWFVFWGVGVRLALAGLRQFFQPAFRQRDIPHSGRRGAVAGARTGRCEHRDGGRGPAVAGLRELYPPIPISAGVFYGVAGFRHMAEKSRSRNETIAMASDLFLFALLAFFVVASWPWR
jgi:hypothetical protein